MVDEGKKIICIWKERKELEVNGGKVHGCPLRPRGENGTIDLDSCKHCASHAGEA